ncbi:MAG: glycosyl hydrolase family 8 [Candidatus Bathyarchaeota archaeon]
MSLGVPGVGQPRPVIAYITTDPAGNISSNSLRDEIVTEFDRALGPDMFLAVGEVNGEKVAFVQSPTEGNRTVSEGMGYALKTVVNICRKLDPNNAADRAKLDEYQLLFNALLRGTEMMKNDRGLPGWKCFYTSGADEVEFKAEEDKGSASDADVYIAWALVWADTLSRTSKGGATYWDRGLANVAGKNYQQHVGDYLQRIQQLEIMEVNGRLLLTVSDEWGEEDIKGAVTVNPSYFVLAAFYDFAAYDKGNKDYWLRLRRDSFEVLAEARLKANEYYLEGVVYEVGSSSVSVEGPYFTLFQQMLLKAKLSPAEVRELQTYGVSLAGGKLTYDHKVVLGKEDGSWDIPVGLYKMLRRVIREQKLYWFLPDWAEVEVADDGTISVRPEAGYGGTHFFELYDAIRVYKEVGEDVLLHDDRTAAFVPAEYKVTQREIDFIEEFLPYRDDSIHVDLWDSSVALSCHFMAAAGNSERGSAVATSRRAEYFDKWMGEKGLIDREKSGRRRYRYYPSMLGLLSASGYLASDTATVVPLLPATGGFDSLSVARVDRDETLSTPLLGSYNLDYFARGFVNDIPYAGDHLELEEYNADLPWVGNVEFRAFGWSPEPLNKVVYSISAQRRRYQSERQLVDTDPASVYMYAESLLGEGKYHSASRAFFRVLCVVESSPDGMMEEAIFASALKRYMGTLKTLNVSEHRVADDLKWMLDREGRGTVKSLYLRGAYIGALNRLGRCREAIRQSTILLEDYKALYGDYTPFSGTADWWKENASPDRAFLLGSNLSVPIPRKMLYAYTVSELVYATSFLYETAIDQFDCLAREYYYDTSVILGNSILGDRTPMTAAFATAHDLPASYALRFEAADFNETNPDLQHGDPEIYKAASLAISLREDFPEEMDSRVVSTMGKVMLMRGVREKEELDQRKTFSDKAIRHYSDLFYGGVGFQEQIDVYETAISSSEASVALFREGTRRELAGMKDSDYLAEAVGYVSGVNIARAKYLTEEEKYLVAKVNQEVEVRVTQNPGESLVDFSTRKAAIASAQRDTVRTAQQAKIDVSYSTSFAAVSGVLARLNTGFTSSPVFTELFAMPYSSGDDELARAASEIAQAEIAADPRGAKTVDWIKQAVDVLLNWGAATADPTKIDQARETLLLIPDVFVSNPEQRALFAYEAILKLADLLQEGKTFLIKAEVEDRMKVLQSFRSELEILFRAMLGEEIPTGITLTPETQAFLDLLTENRGAIKIMFARERSYEAKARVQLGNLMWWGEADPDAQVKAEDQYKKALSIDPASVGAMVGLMELYIRGDKKDYDVALRLGLKATMTMLSTGIDPDYAANIGNFMYQLSTKNVFGRDTQADLNQAVKEIKQAGELNMVVAQNIAQIFRGYSLEFDF